MSIDTLLRRANVRGHELRRGITTFAHQLTTMLGLPSVSVDWSSQTSTAAISAGGRMVLADVADDLVVSRATVARYAGFVFHELLHRKFTDFQARGSDTYTDHMHNAVEDAWIEHRAIASGLVPNAATLLGDLVDVIVRESLAQVTDWADPRQYPFVFAIALRDHAKVKVPMAQGLAPIAVEARARLNAATSSRDTLAIAEWIVSQIKALPQQGQQAQQQQQGDQQGPAEASEGPSEARSGEGEGEGGTPSNESPVGPARAPSQIEAEQSNDPEVTLPQQASAGGYFSERSSMDKPGAHVDPKWVVDAPLFNAPAGLRREVTRLFEDSDTSGFDVNRRAGSLNVGTLARVAVGSDRVFKRRVEHEGIESAVVIVLDVSGSMRTGGRIEAAIQACDALLDSLKAAGVKVAVLTFNDQTSLLADFGEPVARVKAKMRHLRTSSGTNDWFAIRTAHDMLLRRSEARRVCFVLTDGDGDRAAVRAQCISGAALGITTIGVGIGIGNSVDRVYPVGVKVPDVNALATVALSKIKVAA